MAVVVVGILAFNQPQRSFNAGPVTIVPAGTVYTVTAQNFTAVPLQRSFGNGTFRGRSYPGGNRTFTGGPPSGTFSLTITVTGAFTATSGVTAYIMSASQYNSFASSGTGGYLYSTGSIKAGTINTSFTLTFGDSPYRLIFANDNPSTPATVTITQNIVIQIQRG